MANDQHGVKMIYPSKNNGEFWISDNNPNNDGRIQIFGNGGTITYRAATNDYTISQNTNVRIGIKTSAGFNSSNVTLNHNVLFERGYMMDQRDWKNIEVTIYFRYSGTANQVMALYSRTGRHASSRRCEGFAYKSTFNFSTGRVRFVKEQWHVNQLLTPEKPSGISSPRNVWVGMKFCIFNINNGTNVKGETYIDVNETNEWTKVDEFVDAGGWGSSAGTCQSTSGTGGLSGGPDYIGTHGGPFMFYKWANEGSGSVIFKKLSVREIDIGLLDDGSGNPDPDPPDPPPPGSTDPPIEDPPTTGAVFANLVGVYNINFNIADGCSGLLVDVPPLQVLFSVPKNGEALMNSDRDHVGLIAHDESETTNDENNKSILIGKKIRRVDLILSKFGGAIGHAALYIKRNSGNAIVTEFGSVDVSTLPQFDTVVTFEDMNNSHRMTKDDRLVLVYTEGSNQTFIKVGINTSDVVDGSRTCLVFREPNPSSHYVEFLTQDLAGTVYV